MKRCIHCNKLVWFWQSHTLTGPPAHAGCDYVNFSAAVDFWTAKGYMTPSDALGQKVLRKNEGYTL